MELKVEVKWTIHFAIMRFSIFLPIYIPFIILIEPTYKLLKGSKNGS